MPIELNGIRIRKGPARRVGRILTTVSLLFVLPALACCNQAPTAGNADIATTATAPGEALRQSRDDFAKAAERLSQNVRPITDPARLASRLRIDPARAKLLTTGGQTSRPPSTAVAMNYSCGGGECTCYGDDDCNSMFSGICRSPSTGGRCEDWGDGMTVCTCKVATDDYTPTPTEPG